MALRERLTPAGIRILKLFKELKHKPIVKQGYPAEDDAKNQTDGDGPLTVLQVAVFHEFGTSNGVPERSHIRSSFDENASKLQAFARKLMGQMMDGKVTLEQALDRLGLYMLRNHRAKIRSRIPPPLSIATAEQRFLERGDANPVPLVDTGQMLNSSTFKRIMKP